MNQIQIQKEHEERVIAKAKLIAMSRRVRRSESNPLIWCVQSESNPNAFYEVRYDENTGTFLCDCAFFQHRLLECKHLYAVALKEGGFV